MKEKITTTLECMVQWKGVHGSSCNGSRFVTLSIYAIEARGQITTQYVVAVRILQIVCKKHTAQVSSIFCRPFQYEWVWRTVTFQWTDWLRTKRKKKNNMKVQFIYETMVHDVLVGVCRSFFPFWHCIFKCEGNENKWMENF